MQVSDLGERTLQVRLLLSAANGGDAFTLRAEVHEGMIDFVRRQHPQALPRLRLDGEAEGNQDPGQAKP